MSGELSSAPMTGVGGRVSLASSAAGVDLTIDDDFLPTPLPLPLVVLLALVAAFRCGLAAGGFFVATEAADFVATEAADFVATEAADFVTAPLCRDRVRVAIDSLEDMVI